MAFSTRILLLAPLVAAVCASVAPSSAAAETCTRDAARKAVDEAGARLRVLTAETQPKLQSRLRQLKEKRGWTDASGDEKAAALMSDERTAELDGKAASLLARIDELSEGGTSDQIDCARLSELEAASLELQATVRTKSQHVLARLDQEISGGATPPAAAQSSASPAAPASQLPSPPRAAAAPIAPEPNAKVPSAPALPPSAAAPKRQADATPPPTPMPPPAAKAPKAPVTGWTTETVERQTIPLPPANPPTPAPQPPTVTESSDGFSRDEIGEASRGFFGTISSGLGTVIEHAFSTLGRPTGYVLGSEGGGAFIAGVRYGKGQLFMRDGIKRDVHWHGPSIGYDIGASGSKTMFLVYNLRNDIDIFSGFSGVEGSAYLVGGVGMTVLTDGKIVMAPIRSGVGVRLGASIGYLRFTARPTWNPF